VTLPCSAPVVALSRPVVVVVGVQTNLLPLSILHNSLFKKFKMTINFSLYFIYVTKYGHLNPYGRKMNEFPFNQQHITDVFSL
jgi:hypothetical protein